MRTKAGTPPTDATIAAAARRQHGAVSRAQLRAAGLDDAAIRRRIAAGRLHRLHRGVYAVGYVSSSPHAKAMAAVLACGTGAVLSHRSAAALWRLAQEWPGQLEITAHGEHVRRGLLVHRARSLSRADRTSQLGIPVTTPARTLVDLADVLDDRALSRAVNEALAIRAATLDGLAAALARAAGRRAARRLRTLVPAPGEGPTRSAFEDAFLVFIARHRLPRPRVNATVSGYEVDMLWPNAGLIVELDGRAAHDTPERFERDRARDAELTANGYRVYRLTWRRLREQPSAEATRLRALIARTPPDASP